MISNKTNIWLGVALVIFSATMKVSTFPFSFNPIIAVSLFSGAVFTNRKMAFLLPLLSMFLSDVLLEAFNITAGFYGMGQIGNYASLLMVTALGFGLKRINAINVTGYSIASTLLFFLLSNTNCFLFDGMTYEKSVAGWATCLAAGIPFLKNSLITDLFFSGILFGTYALVFRTDNKKAVA